MSDVSNFYPHKPYEKISKSAINPVDFTLAKATKSDVKYRLFSKSTNSEGLVLPEESVSETDFDRTLPTKVLIHGWLSNENNYYFKPIKDAYLLKGDYNVILVDWSAASGPEIKVSAANVKPVGSFIAEFLIKSKIPVENIHIFGHSLGSHLAGFVGKNIFKNTKKKIARITLSDPGGPLFDHESIDEDMRACASDAEFVDAIHTDIGHYGFIMPIGHVDYYPNGGYDQPGCVEKDDINYSHAFANHLFIESINSTSILATKCTSWEEFKKGNCKDKEKIIFGENVSTSTRGVFFFVTNSEAPFAKS